MADWYMTPAGYADPRPPTPRPIVGPLFSQIGDDIVFTAEMSVAEIRALRPSRPKFNQPQIEADNRSPV